MEVQSPLGVPAVHKKYHQPVQDEMEYLDLLETMNLQYEQLQEESQMAHVNAWRQQNYSVGAESEGRKIATVGLGDDNGNGIGESSDDDMRDAVGDAKNQNIILSTDTWRFASLLDSSVSSSAGPMDEQHVENDNSVVNDSDNGGKGDGEMGVDSVEHQSENGDAQVSDNTSDQEDPFENIHMESSARHTVPVEVTPLPLTVHEPLNSDQPEEASQDKHITPPAHLSNGGNEISSSHSSVDQSDGQIVALDAEQLAKSDSELRIKQISVPEVGFFLQTKQLGSGDSRFVAKGSSIIGPQIRSKMRADEFQKKRIALKKSPKPEESEPQLRDEYQSPAKNHRAKVSIPLKVYERPGDDGTAKQNPAPHNDGIRDDTYDKPLTVLNNKNISYSPDSVALKPTETSTTDAGLHAQYTPVGVAEDDENERDALQLEPEYVTTKESHPGESPEITVRARIIFDDNDGDRRSPAEAQQCSNKKNRKRTPTKSKTATTKMVRSPWTQEGKRKHHQKRKKEQRENARTEGRLRETTKRVGAGRTKHGSAIRRTQRQGSDDESTTSSDSSTLTTASRFVNIDRLEEYQKNLRLATERAKEDVQKQFKQVNGLTERAMQRMANFSKLDSHIHAQMDENLSQVQKLSETVLRAEQKSIAQIQDFKQRAMDDRVKEVLLRAFGAVTDVKEEFPQLFEPPNWIEDAGLGNEDEEQVLHDLEEHQNNIIELAGQFDSKVFKENLSRLSRRRELILTEVESRSRPNLAAVETSFFDEFEDMWDNVMRMPVELPGEVEEDDEDEKSGDPESLVEIKPPPIQKENSNSDRVELKNHPEFVDNLLRFSILHRVQRIAADLVPKDLEEAEKKEEDDKMDVKYAKRREGSEVERIENETTGVDDPPAMKERQLIFSKNQAVHISAAAQSCEKEQPTSHVIKAGISSQNSPMSIHSKSETSMELGPIVEDQRDASITPHTIEDEPDDSKLMVSVDMYEYQNIRTENTDVFEEVQKHIDLKRNAARDFVPVHISSIPKRSKPSLRDGMHEVTSKNVGKNASSENDDDQTGLMFKNHELPRMSSQREITTSDFPEYHFHEIDDTEIMQVELHRMSERALESVSSAILHHIVSEPDTALAIPPPAKQTHQLVSQIPPIHLLSPELIQYCIDNDIMFESEEFKSLVAEVLENAVICPEDEIGKEEGNEEVDVNPIRDVDPVDSIANQMCERLVVVVLELVLRSWESIELEHQAKQEDSSHKGEEVQSKDKILTRGIEVPSEPPAPKSSPLEKEGKEMSEPAEEDNSKQKKKGYFETIFSNIGRADEFVLTGNDTVFTLDSGISARSRMPDKEPRTMTTDIEVQTSLDMPVSPMTDSNVATTQTNTKQSSVMEVQTLIENKANMMVQTETLSFRSKNASPKSETTSQSSYSSIDTAPHLSRTNYSVLRKRRTCNIDPSEAERRLRQELNQRSHTWKKSANMRESSEGSDSSVQTFDTLSSGYIPDITSVPLMSFDSTLDHQIRDMWEKGRKGHGRFSWFSLSEESSDEAHRKDPLHSSRNDELFWHVEREDSALFSEDENDDNGDDDDFYLSSSMLLRESDADVGHRNETVSIDRNDDGDNDSYATSSSLDTSFYDMQFNKSDYGTSQFGSIVSDLLKEELVGVESENESYLSLS